MSNTTKICFVGDSLVNGACDETMLGWAGRVCSHAYQSTPNLTCYNLGIRGNTSSDIVSRWQAECNSRFKTGDDKRIVFSFGINDTALINNKLNISKETTVNNIQEILQEKKDYKIIFIGPPPVTTTEHNKRLEALNNKAADITTSHNISYIDLFTPLIKDQHYINDIQQNTACFPSGYHPTSRGYSMISEIIINNPKWWYYRKSNRHCNTPR